MYLQPFGWLLVFPQTSSSGTWFSKLRQDYMVARAAPCHACERAQLVAEISVAPRTAARLLPGAVRAHPATDRGLIMSTRSGECMVQNAAGLLALQVLQALQVLLVILPRFEPCTPRCLWTLSARGQWLDAL